MFEILGYIYSNNIVYDIIGRAGENNIPTIMSVAVKSRVDNKNSRHVHRTVRKDIVVHENQITKTHIFTLTPLAHIRICDKSKA